MCFVVLIIGNSKSNPLGAQGTFMGKRERCGMKGSGLVVELKLRIEVKG